MLLKIQKREMSLVQVGTLMIASKIFNGGTDIVAGYVVNNTNKEQTEGGRES